MTKDELNLSSIRLQQPAQTQQHSLWPMKQIAPAHDNDPVPERFQKFGPRLALAGRPSEVDDERLLRTQVIYDEGPDLAVADEAVMTQAA